MALHGEMELPERLGGVFTFGQPQVGDSEFKKLMEENVLDKYGVKSTLRPNPAKEPTGSPRLLQEEPSRTTWLLKPDLSKAICE
ncbi:hypothetical protein V6N13_070699 [Hibiscus sabdariffa]